MLRLQNLLLYHVPALILTGGSADDLFPALEQTAAERGVPILAAPAGKSRFMVDLSRYLEVAFLPVKALPGTMMEVHGQGVLVLGESGIGKSESALELIRRGHRLVADDVVTFRREHNRRVVGFADSRIKYHMEIRGIGIIDVRALFGISAVMEEMPLDIVICLKPATDKAEFDRLGLIHLTHSIFDVEIPKLELPVRSGRNIAIQVEVAALNEHLKRQGHDSARLLMDRLFNNEEEKIGE
jgi:HPr kinase/phosphorylase